MLLHHKLLLDRNEGTNEFSTDEALSCEPYYHLQPSSVCQLFNLSMASQPVPDPLLQEVLRYCQQPHQKPRDHKELRECVNKHSILASKPETGFFSWLSSGRVTDVECLTAGIIPLHVESEVGEVGNMVIYDFAGQQEYYSSHAAVLERIMRNSAAIFVCIVDLSQCMDKISESIHYWISS